MHNAIFGKFQSETLNLNITFSIYPSNKSVIIHFLLFYI